MCFVIFFAKSYEFFIFPVKSTCQLERLLHDNENIIMQATLEEYDDMRDNMSFAMLEREKVSGVGGTIVATYENKHFLVVPFTKIISV